MRKFITKKELKRRRARLTQGTIVTLVKTKDPFNPVPVGMTGVVRGTDDSGTTYVSWSNGNVYGMIYHIDSLKIIGHIRNFAS